MAAFGDIDWTKKNGKEPISKSHPYKFPQFTNPKKRKIYEKTDLPAPPIMPAVDRTKVPSFSPSDKSRREILLRTNFLLEAYLNLIFNICIFLIVMILIVKGIVMIKNDINIRINMSTEKQIELIKESRRLYYLNKCTPGDRVPAMEKQCQAWEACMNQDPIKQEILKVVLRLISEGAEELMSALSIRTVLLATFVLLCILRYRK